MIKKFQKVLPNLNYDFLYIDGPVDRKVFNNKNYPKKFNSDLINILLKSNLKINAILDQRIHSYRVFKKLLNKNKIKYDVIKKSTFFNDISKEDLVNKF